MKILFIGRTKDIFLQLPLEVQLQLNEDALAYIQKYREAGICLEAYNITGKFMNVTIWEEDSAEAVAARLVELQISPFMDFDMYVLSDFDANMVMHNEKMKAILSQQ